MSKNWNKLWTDEDKLKRWSVPDKHFLEFMKLDTFENKGCLDIGTGIGRHAVHLAKLKNRVEAFDSSINSIEYLNNRIKENKYCIHAFCEELSSINNMESGNFDILVCWNVLYHNKMADILDILKEMERVLKPGGYLFITFNSTNNFHYGDGKEIEKNTFSGQDKDDGDHLHHYSDENEVRELLKNFNIVYLKEDEEEVGSKIFKDRWHWYVAAIKKRG